MSGINSERLPIPTNEYGVVIPPEMQACMGEGCCGGVEGVPCKQTRHHLHSSAPFYEEAGEVAAEFRDLTITSVWLPRCRHTEHHNEHIINVPIPSVDVMRQSIEDEKKIRRLLHTQREIAGNDRVIASPDTGKRETRGLLRRRESLTENYHELLPEVLSIDVIPEELITGALLKAAPGHAKSRVMMGSDVVLPGSLLKTELSSAMLTAASLFQETRQTGVDRVQLAA